MRLFHSGSISVSDSRGVQRQQPLRGGKRKPPAPEKVNNARHADARIQLHPVSLVERRRNHPLEAFGKDLNGRTRHLVAARDSWRRPAPGQHGSQTRASVILSCSHLKSCPQLQRSVHVVTYTLVWCLLITSKHRWILQKPPSRHCASHARHLRFRSSAVKKQPTAECAVRCQCAQVKMMRTSSDIIGWLEHTMLMRSISSSELTSPLATRGTVASSLMRRIWAASRSRESSGRPSFGIFANCLNCALACVPHRTDIFPRRKPHLVSSWREICGYSGFDCCGARTAS